MHYCRSGEPASCVKLGGAGMLPASTFVATYQQARCLLQPKAFVLTEPYRGLAGSAVASLGLSPSTYSSEE
jgi:hypothetical protein